MATTTPSDVDTSIPEVWAKNILRETAVAGFWGRFVGGEGSGAPIIQKSELLNKPGDLIHIQTTSPLTGEGVTGDTTTLIGTEESLSTSEIKVSPLLYRHAVRVNRRAKKKSIVDLRNEAEFRLSEWGESKFDAVRFEKFSAVTLPSPLGSESYTPNAYGPDGHADVDDIVADDVLTVRVLQEIKLILTNQRAKALTIDGFPHYVLVTHPNATFQLKQEDRYESWVRDAMQRGPTNPFFRGALAVVDGMILYEHPSISRADNEDDLPVARSIAFGAEAFVEGLDENVHSETETFDYGLEWGISYEFAFQPRRALEMNSLQVALSAPDVE